MLASHHADVSTLSDAMRGRRRRSLPVMKRKGEDTFAIMGPRMPYVAKIRCDDPFRLADRREIEAMVQRVAAVGEFSPSRADARALASCRYTSRLGPRRARCGTGSTAEASCTGPCRCLFNSPQLGAGE